MGRPQIARKGLPGNLVDSSRAGITPRTLCIVGNQGQDMLRHHQFARGWYTLARSPGLRRKVAWPLGKRYTHKTMRTRSTLPVGKLPPAMLQSLLRACHPPASSGVVIGPRYGEDAAVIDLGAKYLVAKTDPITFTAERIGWYAVNINANDVATLGARPLWFLATLLLPEKATSLPLVRKIFRETLG